jgi:hypothetical protein
MERERDIPGGVDVVTGVTLTKPPSSPRSPLSNHSMPHFVSTQSCCFPMATLEATRQRAAAKTTAANITGESPRYRRQFGKAMSQYIPRTRLEAHRDTDLVVYNCSCIPVYPRYCIVGPSPWIGSRHAGVDHGTSRRARMIQTDETDENFHHQTPA